jgi:DNA adenine methylase
MSKISTPLKTHGGKHYLRRWTVERFPADYQRLNYHEPYVGGGSVFFYKDPSPKESINDIDLPTYCFYRAIQECGNVSKLQDRLLAYEYTEEWFLNALSRRDVGVALSNSEYLPSIGFYEFIVRRMSRGGLGESFAWSDRERGGMPGDLNAYRNAVASLPVVHRRLQGVKVTNLAALPIIQAAGCGDLLYLDPPYLHETRAKGSTKAYRHEMSLEDHADLLDACVQSEAKIALAGYRSKLYDDALGSWNRHEKSIVNHSSQAKTKQRKIECLWTNY